MDETEDGGWRTSAGIGQIAAHLAIAQGAFQNPPRDREVSVQTRTGGNYKFKYATLSAVLDAVRKPLSDNGLAFVHIVSERNGRYRLLTRLIHASGEWIESETPLFVVEQTNQAFGSALTYGKRYALCALLGVAADEDDDGNAADGNAAQGRDRVPRRPPLAAPAGLGAAATSTAPSPIHSGIGEPPYNPETGEILAPHAITLRQDERGYHFVEWGGALIAAIKAAQTQSDIDAWVAANQSTLDAAAGTKAHNSVTRAIAARRAKIGQEEPEMLRPDETAQVLR